MGMERERMPSSYSAHGLGKLKPKIENPGGNAHTRLRLDCSSSSNMFRSVVIYDTRAFATLEVLTTMTLKIQVFWDTTLCRWVNT
jgi:hypothetical protein